MHVQPFDKNDANYQALADLENSVWTEFHTSAELLKHRDSTRDPQYLYDRHKIEADGQMIAYVSYGHTSWSFQPGKFFAYIVVHPAYRQRGIGSFLYNRVMEELSPHKPAILVGNTRENQPEGIAFLEKRGFELVMRFPVSCLETAAFDPGRYTAIRQQVQESGIVLTNVADLRQRDPDWLRKLYDLEWELLQDVPYHDTFTQRPFEQWGQIVSTSPTLFPEGWAIALDGDNYVGMSALWLVLGKSDELETGLTGVIRSHRRRGLATALKAQAIGLAKSRQVETILTDNEENNPMYQLNLMLGFKPRPASLDYVKKVTMSYEL